jgi:predicted secreted protein
MFRASNLIRRRARAVVWAAACLAPAVGAAAQGVPAVAASAALLQFDASARADVLPDRAIAVFVAQRQGSDVAALNAEVAGLLDAGLKLARGVPGIVAQTGSFQTSPQFADNRQTGWSVQAQLIVRCADAAALGRLAGQLAQTLQVQSVGAEFSDALQQREQQQLTQAAIAAFRARAQAAARDFGYCCYALRDVNVGSLQGAEPGPRPLLRAFAAAAPNGAEVPIDPGTRSLSVVVSGSVQLLR